MDYIKEFEMISAYIFSFAAPVSLLWVERCAKESFSAISPDHIFVYKDMGDIAMGPRERVKRGQQSVSLAEFRRFARARKRGAARVTAEQALKHACH